MKVRELSNALIGTRAFGTQTGASIKEECIRFVTSGDEQTRIVDRTNK
ncbi:MAG: hypothetical protein LBM69_06140 [Lachnospiraceae bacterium]|nr:hypothetical protein [Lachnospiraceae bacterium]